MSPRQKKSLSVLIRSSATIKRKKLLTKAGRQWLHLLNQQLNRKFELGSLEAGAIQMVAQLGRSSAHH